MKLEPGFGRETIYPSQSCLSQFKLYAVQSSFEKNQQFMRSFLKENYHKSLEQKIKMMVSLFIYLFIFICKFSEQD